MPTTPLQALLNHMAEEIAAGKTEDGYKSLSFTLVGHRADGGTETIEVPNLVPFNGEHYLGFGIITDPSNVRIPGEGYEERGPGPHLPTLLVYGWEAVPRAEGDPAYTITVQRVATYQGYNDGRTVGFTTEEGAETPLPHLVRHSPTGFSWGYGGSGPADLARSLLVHATGDDSITEHEYMEFKFEVVAKMPEGSWGLPQHAIRTWHEQWLATREDPS